MEKAYTRLSLEQIQKELKKSIEEKEALYNKWNEVEHLTKKDGFIFSCRLQIQNNICILRLSLVPFFQVLHP